MAPIWIVTRSGRRWLSWPHSVTPILPESLPVFTAATGKPRYLGYLPRVWRHLERDLEHLSLGQLKSWYDKTIPKEVRSIVPLSEAAA